jgi:predicted DNA-binding helix-hairpin-helix protein
VLLCGLIDYDLRITLLNLACIYICVHCLLSESYTTEASTLFIEAVNSHFHKYGCGYHHNHIDGAYLDACTGDAEDDSVAHYAEYYD